jgi:membrane protein required for colicin V production
MTAPIATVDFVFLAVLIFSLLLGAWRGLVFEVLSVLSWIAAFVLAQWLALDVAKKLPMSGASESVQYAAGFVLVFVLAIFAGGLLASLIKKMFAAVGLAPADRALGAIFGVVRGVVFLLAATVAVGMTPLHTDEGWQTSVGAGLSLATLKALRPVLPEAFAKYLLP